MVVGFTRVYSEVLVVYIGMQLSWGFAAWVCYWSSAAQPAV